MRGRPFELGNKIGKGRPAGSRNKKNKLAEMLESRGEPIVQQCQLMALKGDRTAMRLCMERLIPLAKPSVTRFRLPKIETAADMKQVLTSILKQAATGRVSPQDAELLARVAESYLRAIGNIEHDRRLEALETAASKPSEEEAA
jgi:hypothetical protein